MVEVILKKTSPKVNAHRDQYYNLSEKIFQKEKKIYDILGPQLCIKYQKWSTKYWYCH